MATKPIGDVAAEPFLERMPREGRDQHPLRPPRRADGRGALDGRRVQRVVQMVVDSTVIHPDLVSCAGVSKSTRRSAAPWLRVAFDLLDRASRSQVSAGPLAAAV